MGSCLVFNPYGDGLAYSEANFSGMPFINFETPSQDGFAFNVRNDTNGPEQRLVVRAWDTDGNTVVNELMTVASINDGGSEWMSLGFVFAGIVDPVSMFSLDDLGLAFDNMTFPLPGP